MNESILMRCSLGFRVLYISKRQEWGCFMVSSLFGHVRFFVTIYGQGVAALMLPYMDVFASLYSISGTK